MKQNTVRIYPLPLFIKLPGVGVVSLYSDSNALRMTPSQAENLKMVLDSCEDNPSMLSEITDALMEQMMGRE